MPAFELPPDPKPARGRGRGGRGRGRGRGAAKAEAAGGKDEPSEEPAEARTYTEAEKRELLKDYTLLSPEYWRYLKKGNFVRYVHRKNGFRRGGYIHTVRYTSRATTTGEKDMLRMLPEYNTETSPGWSLAWEDITDLYISPDVSLIIMRNNLQDALSTMNDNYAKIASAIHNIEVRLGKLEATVAGLPVGGALYPR